MELSKSWVSNEYGGRDGADVVLIENLVFRGGGAKGLSYCGAIKEMDRFGMLANVRRYAGSSAGAITAALLAVGFTPNELEEEMKRMDFGSFKDKENILLSSEKFINSYGFYKGDVFFNWVGDLIKKKTKNPDITFKQLYDLLHTELVITGTCITHLVVHYFSFKTEPDMIVRDALRISMSVPLLFEPVKRGNHLFVDGGVGDNFPLNIFDSEHHSSDSSRLEDANMSTLGFSVLSDKLNITEDTPRQIENLKDYVSCLMDTFKQRIADLTEKPEDGKRTVQIYTHYIATTSFHLTDDEKELLLHEGRTAFQKRFLSTLDCASASAGRLVIKIIRGEGLKAGDFLSSDPFCSIQIGRDVKKTSVKRVTLKPSWNENFIFKIENKQQMLKIEVLDSHVFRSKTGFLGEVLVNLAEVADSETVAFNLPLLDPSRNPTKGNLKFTLHFSPSFS